MHIRKATLSDARGIAQVHVDSWLATYHNIVPFEYLNQLTYNLREQLWKRNLVQDNVFVAENDKGVIIGFADGGKARTAKHSNLAGELYSIYVLPEYQGHGMGKFLLKEVINDLIHKEMNSLIIWVLKDNPSCAFYEKMGGKLVDSKSIEIAGKELIEVAYGWDDIATIK